MLLTTRIYTSTAQANMASSTRPIILQLGDNIRWNHELYEDFKIKFEVRRAPKMTRQEFLGALRDNKFGSFFAIYRPFFDSGGEMGRWDSELISLLPPSCKIYAAAGSGFDSVDTACLGKKGKLRARQPEKPNLLNFLRTNVRRVGILYCNSASACTESVADAAIWLILSAFRLLSWSTLAARSCDPAQFREAMDGLGHITHNPRGHTLGIIGFGRIGRLIADKAYRSFGMKIIYHDIIRMPYHVETTTNAVFHKDMTTMLQAADCVVLATPFEGKTLLDRAALAHMKRGSRLVNIGRGKLLDEDALGDALDSGNIAAAGLDVHCDEPNVNPKLAQNRLVQVTCHSAGASLESHSGFERLGMENILKFYDTGLAISPVNKHLLH